MTVTEVVPSFLAVCPRIGPAWDEHLQFWEGEPERGYFNDAGVVAQHLVDRFQQGDVSEFPAAFDLIERCLTEGDEQVKEVVILGIIEGIQNVASHRPFGMIVFRDWLKPSSRAAWDELCAFWDQVIKAKARGRRRAIRRRA
jgi:hypothetical protein